MAYRLSFRSMGLLTIGGVSVFASAWASASSLSGTAYTPTWVWVCLVGFACLICMGVLWELHQRQQVRRLALQHGLAQNDTLSRITQQMSALQNSNMTAAAKAQELNQRLRMVFDLADDGMFLLKVELADSFRVLAANKAYLRLLTRDKKQTIGHRIDELRANEQDKKALLKSCKQAAQEGEPVSFTETLHTEHGVLHLETTLTPIFDELRYCTHIQGVSRLQQGSGAQNTLLQVAQYDALTGLPKNDAILTHMQTLLSPRGIQKHPFAVVCLQVNAYAEWLKMGHHTANMLMQTLAHRLRTHLHEHDVIGLSQDHTFLWVLHDSPTQKAIESRVSQLLNAINLPVFPPKAWLNPM